MWIVKVIYLISLTEHSAVYLIIIFVHAGIISLEDELLLEVHVALILDVFREPLFWAAKSNTEQKV